MIQVSDKQSNTRERLLYHLRKRLMNKNEWNGRMFIVPLLKHRRTLIWKH